VSWSGFIWHRADESHLVDCAMQLRVGLETQLEDQALSLVHIVEANNAPFSKRLDSAFAREDVERALLKHGGVCLVVGTDPEAPEVELCLSIPFWRQPRTYEVRYRPTERETEWNLRGAVTFNLHGGRWKADQARRIFEHAVRFVPSVEAAALHSRSLRSVVCKLAPKVSPPASWEQDVLVPLGLVQYFSADALERIYSSTPNAQDEERLRLRRAPGGGAWLRCPGEGDFDPSVGTHRAWVKGVIDAIPALGISARPTSDPEWPDLVKEGTAALSAALGKRLLRLSYLQHLRDGCRIDDGHGPVELVFEGGVVVHTWPHGNDTRLVAGPLAEHHAEWRHPSGATDTLVLLPLDADAVGELLTAVRFGARQGTGVQSPWAWELHFDGGAVLRMFNRESGASARISVGPDRPSRQSGSSESGWVSVIPEKS